MDTLKEWETATPKTRSLPERAKKAATEPSDRTFLDGSLGEAFFDELEKIAGLAGLFFRQAARREVMPPVTQAVEDIEEDMAERWRRITGRPGPQFR